jgi:hypothetical protein
VKTPRSSVSASLVRVTRADQRRAVLRRDAGLRAGAALRKDDLRGDFLAAM